MSQGENEFRFSLTREEKDYLKGLVQTSIRQRFEQGLKLPAPPSDKLNEHLGAFVTLKIKGQLRGCIGNIYSREPVWQVVAAMAKEAAFHDPRFPPLNGSELSELTVEISILGPVSKCPDPRQIEIGRHGLIIRQGPYSGLLLPQVATEYNWDQETFLSQTCLKAGLHAQAWKEPGTEIFWFEAEVF